MRPPRWSIALTVAALVGVAVAGAQADVTVSAPGVPTTTVAVPTVTVPGLGSVGTPDVHVTVPSDGSAPAVTVGSGTVGPGSTPPVTSTRGTTQPGGSTGTDAQPTAPSAPPRTANVSRPAAAGATSAPAVSGQTATPRQPAADQTRGHRRGVGRTTASAQPSVAGTPPAADPAATRQRQDGGVGAAIDDVVHLLPGWVLAVFLGFAALAAGMAVNAYASGRRARRLAVQRAELVDDVGQLQAALLAPLPSTRPDVSFSVAYRPAAGLAAGGDFYDVFELDPNRTALLLGDVSGHGRESLAQAALVRYTLRTFIAAGHGPAEAIELTDPCLDGHMDGHFATVIAAVYDHDAHVLTYASAGHPPPLVLGLDDGAPTEPASPPIGAGLSARPSDITLDVSASATVCFFTDGVVEARRRGAPLGTERVERMLADTGDDAEALLAAVAAEADELNDDLAVCLLHRTSADSSTRHVGERVGV